MTAPPDGTRTPPPNTAQRPGRSTLRARHLRAHLLVAAWLTAAVLAAALGDRLPAGRWLSPHLLLLGAVTTAVLVWSEHFTVALLHTRQPDERWSTVRLLSANAAAAGVLLGVPAQSAWLVDASCAVLLTAVAAHGLVLCRLGHGALGGRLKPVVAYYRAATGALFAGVVLGLLLFGGVGGPRWHTGLRSAHVHLTVLGWIALPVLGTLFMLWPTVLGVRMREHTTRTARKVLALAGSGLTVAAAGLVAGSRWPTAAGFALYAGGVALAVLLFARTPRSGRRVCAQAAWMLAAACGWLATAVAADLWLTVTRAPAEAAAGLDALLPVLLIGFTGQALFGALTYLLPVVLCRGPKQRAAAQAVLERAGHARFFALNLAVALLALPLPQPASTAGAFLVGTSAIVFLGLVVAVLARRTHEGTAAPTASRWPLVAGTAAGAAFTVLAVLVASGGTAPGGVQTGASGGTGTRTVEVALRNMRISPARIEVPHGTVLRLRVTNEDAQRHDLRVEGGPATALLGKGATQTLDLGPVTGNRSAWCTVPGHRAAGMTLAIAVKGTADGHAGHSMDGGGGALDLGAGFSPGWQPRPAELPPAPAGTLHKSELHATQADVEVAPGVVQRRWTFGGTAPGPTLRGKVGDTFEVTLVNDDEMGHGIDFHPGVLAPDEPMRTIRPGERLVYRFTATRAGAWLYHCSTAPMLQHIANGMYGAIVIDPPDLPAVDHEYLLVSSQLYLGDPGSPEQVDKMRRNAPDAWVFNGVAAQYAKAPLTARAGERVRFWVVAAGPSDGIAFHVVGTVFDTSYKEGSYLLRPQDPGGSQVLDLAPAQGGFVEAVLPAPGHYSFVDHDMRRAEAGAHGTVEVR